jgi:hypothetical protein
VCRTALGPRRILRDEAGRITFKYKDSRDGQWRTLNVSAHELIRRFLQHVLPRGFQRVRYYGWLAPAAQARWERILALLDWKAPGLPLTPKLEPLCPHCGRRLYWIATFKPP